MRVCVEIFWVRIIETRILYSRGFHELVDPVCNPDSVVCEKTVEMFKDVDDIVNNLVVHSTSWRHENEQIILTYIVYSDVFDSSLLTSKIGINDLNIARLNLACSPRPEKIEEKDVLSHAIRHLAFLMQTRGDGKVVLKIVKKETFHILGKIYGDLAGEV